MGSGSPKTEVNEYFMSMHMGFCAGADSLLEIRVGDKVAWEGEVTTQQTFEVHRIDLFGGPKKEGGVAGAVHYLPGGPMQVLSDFLANKLGRGTGSNCPGFRGLTSLFFTGHMSGPYTSRGFYWTANSPYLRDVWAKFKRAPKGLNPSYALIPRTPPTRRAIILAYQFTQVMNTVDPPNLLSRLEIEKAAIINALGLVRSAVESGLAIDLFILNYDLGTFFSQYQNATVEDIDSAIEGISGAVASGLGLSPYNVMTRCEYILDSLSDATPEESFIFVMGSGFANPDGINSYESAGAYLNASMPGVTSYSFNVGSSDTTFTSAIDNTAADDVPILTDTNLAPFSEAVAKALEGAGVVADANPAHMIYECLTNREWGMGAPETLIDKPTFEAVALSLYAEGFGLSMMWTRQSTVEDFISEIVDHIQAAVYVNPRTGLITIKLIRNDYDVDTLRHITIDNANLRNFQRKAWGEITNEIVVTWTNPDTEQDETVTAQDPAAIATQGGSIISNGRNYYGVRWGPLAMRLAARDLRVSSAPVASCDAELDRSGWDLLPGEVVKVTWPEHGLNEVVMRVGPVDYGKAGDISVKASLIEDVFSLTTATYDDPPKSGWVSGEEPPEPMTHSRIITLPSYFTRSLLTELNTTAGYPEVFAGVLASTTQDDASSYDLIGSLVLPDGSTTQTTLGTNTILGRATLAAAVAAEAVTAPFTFTDIIGKVAPAANVFVFIGADAAPEAEMEIALISTASGGTEVKRGILDTVPQAWPEGTPVWFLTLDSSIADLSKRSEGETVSYKLLPRTTLGLLPSAPNLTAVLTDRPYLPNRPANVAIGGVKFNTAETAVDMRSRPDPWVTVSWANRNRTVEDSQVLSWTDASVTPETGQTTTVTVVGGDGATLAEHAGLTGTTFNIPDASFGGESTVLVRVSSSRTDADGTFDSLQGHGIFVRVENLTFDETSVTFDNATPTWDEN